MRILGIDTSSELSSVALVDGDTVITREVVDGRRHAEVLAVLLREVLDEGLRPELIACGSARARTRGCAWESPRRRCWGLPGRCPSSASAPWMRSPPRCRVPGTSWSRPMLGARRPTGLGTTATDVASTGRA